MRSPAPASTLTDEQNELLDLRDRVFDLEQENIALRHTLGDAAELTLFPVEWGLTKLQSRLLAMLLNAPEGYRTSETLRRTLYPHGEVRAASVVSMMVTRSRKRLRPFGIEIVNRRGKGYLIPLQSRARIHLELAQPQSTAS